MTDSYRTFLPHRFEAFATTKLNSTKLISLLSTGSETEKSLARRLARCRKEHPCGSGACPKCNRWFRIWLLRYGQQVIEGGGRQGGEPSARWTPYWSRASVIPRGMTAPEGQLHTIQLASKVKSVAKALSRSALVKSYVIGGADVSLNTTDNANHTWQVHLYLLITGEPTKALKKAVRRAFPPEPTAKRPYHHRQVYSPRGALTYAYKNAFTRRSTYLWEGLKYIKDVPLTGDQQRELAVFLDQTSVGGRLILYGLRRNGEKLEPT